MYRPYTSLGIDYAMPVNKIILGDRLVRGNRKITTVIYDKMATTIICKDYNNHEEKIYRLCNYEELGVWANRPKRPSEPREGMVWAADLRPGNKLTATGGGQTVIQVEVGYSYANVTLSDFSVRHHSPTMAVSIENGDSDEPDMSNYVLDKSTEVCQGAYIIFDGKEGDSLVQVSDKCYGGGSTFLYFTNGKYAKYHQSEVVKVVRF